MHIFKSLFRQLHNALPDKIRYPIDVATTSILDTLQNRYIPAYYVRARLTDGQSEGKVLYLGNLSQYKSWIHVYFGQSVEPVSIGNLSLFQFLRKNESAPRADVTLCPINPFTKYLLNPGWHIIPLFVDCIIDLRKPIHELITSKGANHPMRTARRFDYRFEIIKNDNALYEYFHHMLIPSIQNRHEQRAFLSSWENIQHLYQNGTLITAHLNNEWVGAILLVPEYKNRIRIANLGWRNGDIMWLKNGIVPALYHQSILWAQKKEFTEFNLGGSNPFVNDGPLNFKLKWGATMEAPSLSYQNGRIEGIRSFIGVKFNLESPAAQSLLASVPLLEYAEGKLRAICWNAEIPPSFRRQLDLGCEWINLAPTHLSELSR